ncbi:MAG: MotA/TolQ/ExbB proton channel family protein [Planctomycetes bacterium]|nr:MotA/TolQ/ExbB proton channel family protein [Planctomycetota bacterium]
MMSHPYQLRHDGKAEWLMWFAGLSLFTLGAAVLFAGGWQVLSGDLVVCLILALFLVTLWKSYHDIGLLDRETRLASEQVAQLKQINDVGRFLEAAQPSIFQSHIAALHTIFLSHSSISQETVLEIAHSRLRARNKTVDLLASILITLGLIGTILGLLIAVGGLSGVIGSGDGQMDQVMVAMRTTIEGLGTAFYTTLYGAAAGGIVLRILTSVVDSNILRYMAHIAELTEIYVLPALRRRAAQLEAEGYYRNLDR